jgi:hypothetical protein
MKTNWRVLQRLDQFRLWHSLDEKRYCLVCGKIITGQEVRITGGENGPLRVSCPTEHCNAIPMKWVRPTDEVLIKIAKLQAFSSACTAKRFPSPRCASAMKFVCSRVYQMSVTLPARVTVWPLWITIVAPLAT